MKALITSACLAGVLSVSVPQAASADGVDYDDCVNRRVNWCTSVYKDSLVQMQCILIGMAICHDIHVGGGGGGGVESASNSFTAEQKSTYDTILKDLEGLIREEARVRDALDEFANELLFEIHRYESK